MSGIHKNTGFPLKACGNDNVFEIVFKYKIALLSKLSKVSFSDSPEKRWIFHHRGTEAQSFESFREKIKFTGKNV